MAVGDSITQGFGTSTAYTQHLSLTNGYNVLNLGVDGETLALMVQNYPGLVAPMFHPGFKNVICLWGSGSNDFFIGATAAAVKSNLTEYLQLAHATGFKVIVGTMLSRTGNNPIGGETLDADKDAINAFVGSVGADGIADFSGTTLGCDGCFGNMPDGIHPNANQIVSIEGPVWSAAINALN